MARIPCRKPLISKKNQNIRLDFATEHILWTEEQWNMIHFSDESKFNLFVSAGKRFVRRKNGERFSPQCVKKTVNSGVGSVMVWGGPIVHFHGNINASVYKELLHQHALTHLRKGTVETPIFMQDNVPFHKEKNFVKCSWRGRNSCYEVATTNPRYESSRECMENRSRENSE